MSTSALSLRYLSGYSRVGGKNERREKKKWSGIYIALTLVKNTNHLFGEDDVDVYDRVKRHALKNRVSVNFFSRGNEPGTHTQLLNNWFFVLF